MACRDILAQAQAKKKKLSLYLDLQVVIRSEGLCLSPEIAASVRKHLIAVFPCYTPWWNKCCKVSGLLLEPS